MKTISPFSRLILIYNHSSWSNLRCNWLYADVVLDEQAKYRKQIDVLQDVAAAEGCLDSPINLDVRLAKTTWLQKLAWYNYDLPPKKMKVTNTGHTVVLSAKWFAERPFLARGPLLDTYVFSQVHFHWALTDLEGSEHSVDTKRFPLEMHTVHFKSDYGSQDEALRERDGLFVVGSFFEIQNEDNPDLDFVVDALEHVARPHSSRDVPKTALSCVIRLFEDDYLLYWGSVMTSQCRHQILWAFSRQLVGISSKQLAKFRQILGQTGKPLIKTSRPIHPLSGRTLFHINPSDVSSPTLLPIVDRCRNPVQISLLGPSYVNRPADGASYGAAQSFNQAQSVYLTDYKTRSIFRSDDDLSDLSREACSTIDTMTQMPSTIVPQIFPLAPTQVSRFEIPKSLEAELRLAVQPLFQGNHKMANRSRKDGVGAKSDDEDDYRDAVESFDDLKGDTELELDDIPYQDTDEINRSVTSSRSRRTNKYVDDGANKTVKSKRSVKSDVGDMDSGNKSIKTSRSVKSKANAPDNDVKSKKSMKNSDGIDEVQPCIGMNVKSRKSVKKDDSLVNGEDNEIAPRAMKSKKSLKSNDSDANRHSDKSTKSKRSVRKDDDPVYSEFDRENEIPNESLKSRKSNKTNKDSAVKLWVADVESRNKSNASRKSDKSKDNQEVDQLYRRGDDADKSLKSKRMPLQDVDGSLAGEPSSKSNKLGADVAEPTKPVNEQILDEFVKNFVLPDEDIDHDDRSTNDSSSVDRSVKSKRPETDEEDMENASVDSGDSDSGADVSGSDNSEDDGSEVGATKSDEDDGENKSIKTKRSLKGTKTNDGRPEKSVKSMKNPDENVADIYDTNRSLKSKKSLKEPLGDLDDRSRKSKKSANEDGHVFEDKSMPSEKSLKGNLSELDGKSRKSRNKESPNFDVDDMKSKKSEKSHVEGTDDTNRSEKSRRSNIPEDANKSIRSRKSNKVPALSPDKSFKNVASVYPANAPDIELPQDDGSAPNPIADSKSKAFRGPVVFSQEPDDTLTYVDDDDDDDELDDAYALMRKNEPSSRAPSLTSVLTGSIGTMGVRPSYVPSDDESDQSYSLSSVGQSEGRAGENAPSGNVSRATSHGTASIGISEGDSQTMLDRSVNPSKLFGESEESDKESESGDSDGESYASALSDKGKSKATLKTVVKRTVEPSESKNTKRSRKNADNSRSIEAVPSEECPVHGHNDVAMRNYDEPDSESVTTNISCLDVKDHHMSPKGSSTSYFDYVATKKFESSLSDDDMEEVSVYTRDDERSTKGVKSVKSLKKKSQVAERRSSVKKDETGKSRIFDSSSTKTVGGRQPTIEKEDLSDDAFISEDPSSKRVDDRKSTLTSKTGVSRKTSVNKDDGNEIDFISREPSSKTVGARKPSIEKDDLNDISRDPSSKTVGAGKPSIKKDDLNDISREPSAKTVGAGKSSIKKDDFNDISRDPSTKTVGARKSSIKKDDFSDISRDPSTKTVGARKSSIKKDDLNDISREPSAKTVGAGKPSIKKDDLNDISREPSSKTVGAGKSSIKKDDFNDISRDPSTKTVGARKSSIKKDDFNDISRDPSTKTVGARKSSIKKDDLNDISREPSAKTVGAGKPSIKKDDFNDISRDPSAKTVGAGKSSIKKDNFNDISRDPSAKTVGARKSSIKKDDFNDISRDPSAKTVGARKSSIKKEDFNDISRDPSAKTVGARKSSIKKDDFNDISRDPSAKTVGARKSSIKKDDFNDISRDPSAKTVGARKSSIKKDDFNDISRDPSAKTVGARKSSIKKDDSNDMAGAPSAKTVGARKSSIKKDDFNDISRDPSARTVGARKSSIKKDDFNDISRDPSAKTVGARKSSIKKDDSNDISRDPSAKTVGARKSSIKKDDFNDISRDPSAKTVGARKSSIKKDDFNDISRDPSAKTVGARKSSIKKDDFNDISRDPSAKTVGARKSSIKKDDLNDIAGAPSSKTVGARKPSIKKEEYFEIASVFKGEPSTKTVNERKPPTTNYLSSYAPKPASRKTSVTASEKKGSPPLSAKPSFKSARKSEFIAFSHYSSKPGLMSQKASKFSTRTNYSAETTENVVDYNKSGRLARNDPDTASERLGPRRRSAGKSGEQLLDRLAARSQSVASKKNYPWWQPTPVQFEGYLQTSIDIEQDNIQNMTFPPLEFRNHFNTRGNGIITNEGYTVEMKFLGSKSPQLTGGPLFAGDYEFVGFHLHWGANDLINNHTVNGKLFDMEVHLLHILKDCGSIENAMKLPHGFAIAAFFLEGGDVDNPDFETILTALSHITAPHTSVALSCGVLKLLERRAQPKGYFTYPGSLSIPPYNEVVVWIFYPDPVAISDRQVAEYRKLSKLANYNMKQQYKPPQSINGRPIFHAT